MRDHPDETPSWWQTTLIKDHPDEWPPGERALYWKLFWWEITPLLWHLLWSLLLHISMQKTPDQGHPSWSFSTLFECGLCSLFGYYLGFGHGTKYRFRNPDLPLCAVALMGIPLFTDLSNRVSVFCANISLYHILFPEHSEHTTTETAYVHCHFVSYNCCLTVVLSLELAPI